MKNKLSDLKSPYFYFAQLPFVSDSVQLIKMAEMFRGKWQLTESENGDAYLKKVNLNFEILIVFNF